MRRRLVGGVLLGAVLVLGSACETAEDETGYGTDRDRGQITVTPVQPIGQIPAQKDQRVQEIAIFSDRLDPPTVELTANVPTQLQIANRSGRDCAFFMGEFLLPTTIAAGETRGISLTTPAFETRSGTIGCKDDPSRQGGFTVERRGVPVEP